MVTETNFWTKRRISRRAALRGAGLGVAGLAGAALIGCGGDDDDDVPAAAQATAAAAATTAAAQATAAAATETPSLIKRGGVQEYQMGGDPPSTDPFGNLSYQTKGYAAYFYSRLMKRETKPWPFPGNSTGVTGDLAESLETEDGITYVAKLRPGMKFHNVAPVNGRVVTSEDVAFSWGRLTAAEAAGAAFVNFVEKMDVIDDSTVKFTLKDVSPVFDETLADPNILFVMPTESEGGFDPNLTSIGSGPWVLDEYRTSEVLKVNRNPDWYEMGEDGKTIPYTDGIQVVVIPEYQNQLAQYEAGNIHAQGIRSDDVLGLKDREPDAEWISSVAELQSIIYFNDTMTTDQPWGDDRFRKAVSMALDRDGLLDLAYNVAALRAAGLEASAAWNNIVPAGMTRFWLDPQGPDIGESGQWFQNNVAEAKKLLSAQGVEDGFEIGYHYTNRYGSTWVSVSEANFNMFEQIGLKPRTEVEDYNAVYITQTFRGDFDGMAFGYETPFPEVGGYFPREFGDDPANHGRVHDAKITELTALQAKELDYEQRREFIWEIQRINGMNMYYVPHTHGGGTGWTAYKPFVKGLRQTKSYGAATETTPWRWLDL
ncbi:MAG: ABC transporter substrate-binding protein [Dehalococcoidia bacterium]